MSAREPSSAGQKGSFAISSRTFRLSQVVRGGGVLVHPYGELHENLLTSFLSSAARSRPESYNIVSHSADQQAESSNRRVSKSFKMKAGRYGLLRQWLPSV